MMTAGGKGFELQSQFIFTAGNPAIQRDNIPAYPEGTESEFLSPFKAFNHGLGRRKEAGSLNGYFSELAGYNSHGLRIGE